MIETPLTLFQVQPEGVLGHAAELGESSLRAAPEGLDAVDVDAVDVGLPVGEAVFAVPNVKMLPVAHVHEAVVSASPVRANDFLQPNAAANNSLERTCSGVWDDLGIDPSLALEDAENDGLTACSSAALAPHPTRAKVALVPSTSPPPVNAVPLYDSARRQRILRWMALAEHVDSPVSSAALVAVRSRAKHRASWRNLLSEIFEWR